MVMHMHLTNKFGNWLIKASDLRRPENFGSWPERWTMTTADAEWPQQLTMRFAWGSMDPAESGRSDSLPNAEAKKLRMLSKSVSKQWWPMH